MIFFTLFGVRYSIPDPPYRVLILPVPTLNVLLFFQVNDVKSGSQSGLPMTPPITQQTSYRPAHMFGDPHHYGYHPYSGYYGHRLPYCPPAALRPAFPLRPPYINHDDPVISRQVLHEHMEAVRGSLGVIQMYMDQEVSIT